MTNKKKKTILLVEDEILIAINEKNDLEKYGYEVITAYSGEKSIEIFKNNNKIDLILMDINLGNGIDGTEAATIILKEHEIPIVFLSSHIEPEVVDKTEKITSYGYVVKNSGITILDTSIKMAFKLFEANQKIKNELTERTKAEDALKAIEKSQHELLQDLDQKLRESEYIQLWNVYAQSRVPTFTINKSGKIIDFNKAMVELSGYTHAEVPDLDMITLNLLTDEAYRHKVIEKYRNSMEHKNNLIKEIFIITTKKGEKRHVIISIYDIWHQNQTADIQVIQCEDITEQKKIEQELNESELKYRLLFKSMGQGFYLSDILYDKEGNPYDYKYIDVNLPFEQMVGLTREQLIGKTYNEIVPPDPSSGWIDCFKRVAKTGIPENYTFPSNIYNCYFEVYAFKPNEGKFAALVKDVTDRILAEENIKNLLQKNEIILKEVHHRIKNNMNFIYSLLMLQSKVKSNFALKKILQDTANRIQCMNILYDKLYCSTNKTELSIKDYLFSLISETTKIFSNLLTVKINTQLDNIILDAKTMSTIGLIINELITNAMKFAFKECKDGIINLSATIKNKNIIIIVEDNGIGLPESVSIENSTGFGMTLIGILVKQINGAITIERQNGTKFIIEFKK